MHPDANPAHALKEHDTRVNAAISAPLVDTDHCTERGAARLKACIVAYWRERGFHIEATLVRGRHLSAGGKNRYDLRSDMVDGWPRGERT